eukprot:2208720-Amphidinium_carterae.1
MTLRSVVTGCDLAHKSLIEVSDQAKGDKVQTNNGVAKSTGKSTGGKHIGSVTCGLECNC